MKEIMKEWLLESGTSEVVGTLAQALRELSESHDDRYYAADAAAIDEMANKF
jgi:hypothetical protein